MSKFIRIADKEREAVAQLQGVSPTILGQPQANTFGLQQPNNPFVTQPATQPQANIFGTIPQSTSQPQTLQQPKPAAPNPYNMFAKANITQPYTGTAEQNEALRRVLDPTKPTFYDAYISVYKKWDQHPSQRIENLNGNNAIKAAKAKAEADAKAKALEAYKNNPLNPENLAKQQQYQLQNPIYNPQSGFQTNQQADIFKGILNPPQNK